MKVMITGCTNPLSIVRMWYDERIGEVFEVEHDPNYEYLYLTVEPIHKEHRGHIYKHDCVEVESLPQAIGTTEQPSETAAV
jgi:hypothetical protein